MRFNFRGTPPSEGEFQDMTVQGETDDLKTVIEYARNEGYSRIGLLGESMGGTIILAAYEPSIELMVFWYPAFDFADCAFKNYLTSASQQLLDRQGYLVEEGFKVGKKFIKQIPAIKLYADVKKISCPVLFLHGEADSDVPYSQSEKAFALVPHEHKEIRILKGADHCFKNEQDAAIQQTTTFIKKHF